jgi:prephenate dehydratase
MTETLIAYQGEPGANSHIACKNVYPAWTPLPCATFEDALAAVAEGRAELAMIPIENSIAGRVADIHTLLPASGLFIVGEYFLPIRFQLLGVKGASIEGLTSVYSHVHALGQCRRIIRERGLKAVVTADTAGSAREVADWGDPARASLAPRLAAEIYGLDILASDVEDEKHNMTRFVVLSRTPDWPEPGRTACCVTTFVFRTRNVPAALYKALGGFATNGINMTKLESYMVEGAFTATQFLADVDGHPYDSGLARAMEELAFFSREVRILGVYPAHPDRIIAQFEAD